ncbi:hypothetical protein LVD15_03685 [Fulvivirga maritima]|uniref:hypothetical protein n=1 Tax=Fulvivirga maritima TaxID=2904247 RepID=UPI001F3A2C6B|nr:hypothetical protein [Fulvivirga maritima]UII27545.1 hypothetical protein LVD15_03685 [Fulvivirga maritima]
MTSCSDDDSKEGPEVTNSFMYNSNTYEVKDASITDYGADRVEGHDYYYYEFSLTNGSYELVEDSVDPDYFYFQVKGGTYDVNLDLYYPSASVFGPGEYVFASEEMISDGSIINTPFIDWAEIRLDLNNDGIYDGDETIAAVGGSVEVTGSDKEYTLFFELNLEDGRTLSGSFSGEFKYVKD